MELSTELPGLIQWKARSDLSPNFHVAHDTLLPDKQLLYHLLPWPYGNPYTS